MHACMSHGNTVAYCRHSEKERMPAPCMHTLFNKPLQSPHTYMPWHKVIEGCCNTDKRTRHLIPCKTSCIKECPVGNPFKPLFYPVTSHPLLPCPCTLVF